MNILFKTPHGSHLYGLAHENSDQDFFVVVDRNPTNKKKFAKQSIVDGIDVTIMDLGTWLHYCEIGVPQCLEAMWSTQAEIDLIGPLRAGYTAAPSVYERYLRTIKSFALEGDFKHKRHALRLAMNLRVMSRRGRFNPTLTDMQIMAANTWAELPAEDVLEMAYYIATELDE